MSTRLIHRNQRGFSLIELVIAIALTALVTTGITMTIFQVFGMNTRTAGRMTAVSQVQHAGKLVSEDILEAHPETINATTTAPEFLILGWTAENSTVIYTLEGTELWRSESVNGEAPTLTRVAEYIDPYQTSCVWYGGVLTFTVTATVGNESETRVYEVKPRVGT